uniref:Uncharacterized protein n=1 Tax=Glossina austeni TaxID=7395 RepID=A0A1A9VUI4_GLOAU
MELCPLAVRQKLATFLMGSFNVSDLLDQRFIETQMPASGMTLSSQSSAFDLLRVLRRTHITSMSAISKKRLMIRSFRVHDTIFIPLANKHTTAVKHFIKRDKKKS